MFVAKLATSIIAHSIVNTVVAVAAPAPQPVVIVQPAPAIHYGHGPVRRSVVLASNVQLGRDGRDVVDVGANAGAFHALTLQADNGRTRIDKIEVVFADHQTETFREDATLARNATLTVDLGGRRAIDKVIVTGADHAFSLTATT